MVVEAVAHTDTGGVMDALAVGGDVGESRAVGVTDTGGVMDALAVGGDVGESSGDEVTLADATREGVAFGDTDPVAVNEDDAVGDEEAHDDGDRFNDDDDATVNEVMVVGELENDALAVREAALEATVRDGVEDQVVWPATYEQRSVSSSSAHRRCSPRWVSIC